MGEPLTPDEASLMAQASSFEWTYGDSAPLYIWLQHWTFLALGPSVLALATLKSGILFTTCVFTNRLVKAVAGPKAAWLATLSLAFLPQFIWHSQHQSTGPVLATCVCVITIWVLMRVQRNPSVLNLVCFAVAIALGMLSDPSYSWVILAVGLSVIFSAQFRAVLIKLILTAALALGVAAYLPNSPVLGDAIELIETGPQIASDFMAGEQILTRAYQMYDLLITGTLFVGILLIGAFFAIHRGLGRETTPNLEVVQLRAFLSRTLAIGCVVLLLAVLFGIAGQTDSAFLQPLFVLAAPLVMLFLYPFLDRDSERKVLTAAGIVGALVLLFSPMQYAFNGQDGITAEPKQAPVATDKST